ncbi:uncharacterized protein LOC128312528 [Acinonyx jubatus]|uniref:Uncharacterized protein LOC128312528 n=1 Tax=Acinonyx jubatus TaxID=32536 RepID=A0ABM3NTH6_ACIJB|nr:uncharacterized protein LOC128312528 [Acinonyx jubatus]XP_053062731.1 uncharacterized protein LOC128312528 [Acinonyx jubatus]
MPTEGTPPPKLPGTAAGGTSRSHGTRGRGVPGEAQAYPRCLSFPLSRQRLLRRLGPVWALQLFEALPRTQFSLTLCNTVSWAGVVLPTSQKRKWRPPKGDAQPHRISAWYSEVPRPVDLCRLHPAAGQPGNFLNSATVSATRPGSSQRGPQRRLLPGRARLQPASRGCFPAQWTKHFWHFQEGTEQSVHFGCVRGSWTGASVLSQATRLITQQPPSLPAPHLPRPVPCHPRCAPEQTSEKSFQVASGSEHSSHAPPATGLLGEGEGLGNTPDPESREPQPSHVGHVPSQLTALASDLTQWPGSDGRSSWCLSGGSSSEFPEVWEASRTPG